MKGLSAGPPGAEQIFKVSLSVALLLTFAFVGGRPKMWDRRFAIVLAGLGMAALAAAPFTPTSVLRAAAWNWPQTISLIILWACATLHVFGSFALVLLIIIRELDPRILR